MPDPNLFTRNALLSALAHSRLVPDMERLFASMPERDAVSYNALITGFSSTGSPARSVQLYRALLREESVRPTRITLSAMIMVASALSDRALGHSVHCQVLRLGFGAYAFVGSPLVDMYAKMGLIRDARRVFQEMEAKTVVMYNTLITGLLRCKMIEDAKGLFQLMVDRDSITWTTMVTGLTQNGLQLEALDVFRRMRAEGVGIDQYTFGSILTACGALAALEEGKQIHAYITRTCRIYEKLEWLNSKMAEEGYKPDVSSVLHDVADADKVHMISHHSEKLAIAFGLIFVPQEMPIRIVKNLRGNLVYLTLQRRLSREEFKEVAIHTQRHWLGCKD
uniref:DYW domain-containing protein n=1 Tax=Oryza rufipogon TaxID=4529 RepID=A0A0E0N8M4_ORYRU